jgi:2-polyprenyl-3-methyl-5-hydroxy-6-metoxy-1,4-benzoquinol methylase
MVHSFDPQHKAEFDQYAESYAAMHAKNIAASGEAPEYFAVYKQHVLERLLGAGFERPILDFGCGIGNLTTHLANAFPRVDGYDPSGECVKVAATRAPAARFFSDAGEIPRDHYGALVLANVLHHVTPDERPALLASAASMLAPGGRLVVFEHNPLNPLTRRAVAACPFDENAVLLYPWEVLRLLRGAALSDATLDFIVFFPSALSAMRPLEPHLGWLPLGAQVCAWGARS